MKTYECNSMNIIQNCSFDKIPLTNYENIYRLCVQSSLKSMHIIKKKKRKRKFITENIIFKRMTKLVLLLFHMNSVHIILIDFCLERLFLEKYLANFNRK